MELFLSASQDSWAEMAIGWVIQAWIITYERKVKLGNDFSSLCSQVWDVSKDRFIA